MQSLLYNIFHQQLQNRMKESSEGCHMVSAISNNLYVLRQERELSQRVAARELGISQSLLSHYEKGIREPGLEFICKVCDYYHVSADFLLGRTSVREKPMLEMEEVLPKDKKEKIPDPAPRRTLSKFYGKVLNNATNIVFDLLGQLDDEWIITSAYQYLGTAIYRLYRHLARFAPDNITTLIEAEQIDFTVGATNADLTLCELEYLHGIQTRSQEGKYFPNASYKALERDYPEAYRSLFEIIYTGGKRNQQMLETHQEEGRRMRRERKNRTALRTKQKAIKAGILPKEDKRPRPTITLSTGKVIPAPQGVGFDKPL
jgi:transcriptional regulator with XRE-family HTH domain